MTGTGLEIYNQQYWFRLLTVMQTETPLLCAHLGIERFNALAIAYLEQHPSAHPSLLRLLDNLSAFLAGHPEWGRPRIIQAAELDILYQRAFVAADAPPLGEGSDLLTAPLRFHPSWALFAETFRCVQTRRQVRAEPERAEPWEIPSGVGWWVIHRGDRGVRAIAVDALQARLLKILSEGTPLGAAFGRLDPRPGEVARLGAEVQGWFAAWRGWFVSEG